MQAFDDIDNQTIERFYNNYQISNGDPQYRIVVLGYWTVDIKLRIKYLSEEPDNKQIRDVTTPKRTRQPWASLKPVKK